MIHRYISFLIGASLACCTNNFGVSSGAESTEKGMFSKLRGRAAKLPNKVHERFKSNFQLSSIQYRGYRRERYNYDKNYSQGYGFKPYVFPFVSMGRVIITDQNEPDPPHKGDLANLEEDIKQLDILSQLDRLSKDNRSIVINHKKGIEKINNKKRS